ncbi:hypothetical protein HYQ46_007533 [Verticillium longisporum]|nr:hypothetical protein HYQ46_007533 [Verticillium longisporum]
MDGDILGNSAGETWLELMLALFLLPRGARFGVLLGAGPVEPGMMRGLCFMSDAGVAGEGFPCTAGEVSGLKYEPGMVKVGSIWN